jgi:hypothetical protein
MIQSDAIYGIVRMSYSGGLAGFVRKWRNRDEDPSTKEGTKQMASFKRTLANQSDERSTNWPFDKIFFCQAQNAYSTSICFRCCVLVKPFCIINSCLVRLRPSEKASGDLYADFLRSAITLKARFMFHSIPSHQGLVSRIGRDTTNKLALGSWTNKFLIKIDGK